MKVLPLNAHGGLASIRRKIEMQRLRQNMPWATEREVRATCEHLLHALDLSGHFSAAGTVMPGTNAGAGPSQCIWAPTGGTAFPDGQIRENPNYGTLFHEDFKSFGGLLTTTAGQYAGDAGAWLSYQGASCTIAQVNTYGTPNTTPATSASGAVLLSTPGTNQLTCALEAGYGNGGSWMLTGNGMPTLHFEARVAIDMTTIAAFNAFVGLMEKGGAGAAFFFTTGDALNTKSFMGFYSLTAAVTTIKSAYGINGTAAVTANQSANGTWAVRTASTQPTWMKLGFVYQPNFTNARLMQYFVNGVLQGWVADCSITAFPTKTVLTPTIILQNNTGTGTASALAVDWIRVGQAYQG